ncbi:MAG: hypothetical protein EOP48_11780 [Sphingobacteriales bacterium]|nr:MAG: hypothetical protein EOP48_11780 [Sphingobacteriales bacterium]
MNERKKDSMLHSFCSVGFVVLYLVIGSCNEKNEESIRETDTLSIQSYIDSCSKLYSMAIEEVKQGHSKKEVKYKYASSIISLHSKFRKSFDSITLAYTNKTITQVRYENVMKSLVLDSVGSKSEELSRLGVDIDLK